MAKILKFSASWCQPCKQMSKVLSSMNVQNITEIDVDNESEITAMYQVRGVPTLIAIDAEGVEIDRLVGSHGEKRIHDWLAANGL